MAGAGAAVARVAGDQLRYLGIVAGTSSRRPGLFTPVFVDGRPPDPRRASDLVAVRAPRRGRAGGPWATGVDLDFLTVEEITQFDTGFGEPDGPSLRHAGRRDRAHGWRRHDERGRGVLGPGPRRAACTDGDAGYYNVFVRLRGTAPPDLARFERQVDRLASG